MKYVLLVALLIVNTSCSELAAKVASKSTPPAVESGLAQASSPGSQLDLRQISATVTDSALDRLAASENQKKIAHILRSATTSPASPQEQRELDETADRAARVAVRAALDELRRNLPALIQEVASKPEVRDALRPLASTAAGGAVEGAAQTITGTGEGK